LAQTLRGYARDDGITVKVDAAQGLAVVGVFWVGVALKKWAGSCLNHGRRWNDLEAS
jgi:hypothetical protein